MAVDEVLLETAAATGQATLRFYQWSDPTLSLGYFQSYTRRGSHSASSDCSVVRRLTGGGAILHDHELTYSLALPREHRLAGEPRLLYEALHDALIDVLGHAGIAARRRPASSASAAATQPEFLCFLRQAEGDVLLDQTKVCGSAQRRRRGAVLQHGSLLLARSQFAPELPGILELAGQKLSAGETAQAWAGEIGLALELSLEKGQLSAAEQESVQRLVDVRYASDGWTQRR